MTVGYSFWESPHFLGLRTRVAMECESRSDSPRSARRSERCWRASARARVCARWEVSRRAESACALARVVHVAIFDSMSSRRMVSCSRHVLSSHTARSLTSCVRSGARHSFEAMKSREKPTKTQRDMSRQGAFITLIGGGAAAVAITRSSRRTAGAPGGTPLGPQASRRVYSRRAAERSAGASTVA